MSQDSSIQRILTRADELRGVNYLEASKLMDSVIVLIQTKGADYQTKQETYYLAAEIESETGIYEQAENYLKIALDLAMDSGDVKDQIRVMVRLGENFMDMSRFESATEIGLKALAIAEEIDEQQMLGMVKGSLAETYRYADRMDLAEEYNLEAIEHYKEAESWDQVARCYNNLSATIGKEGRNQEAIDTLKVALTFLETDNHFAKGKHYSNIAFCYRNMGKFDSALYYNRMSLEHKRQVNDVHGIGYSLGAIGRSYIGLGNADSAIFYTRQSLDTALKYNKLFRIKDASQHLSDAYRAAGMLEKALHYQDLVKDYDDSIFIEETTRKIEFLQRKFDFSKKEREIENLKHQQKIEEANLKTITVILISLLIIVICLVFIFYFRTKKRVHEKKLIELELEQSNRLLKRRKDELTNFTQELMEKNKSLNSLRRSLIKKEEELKKFRDYKSEELEQLSELKLLTDEDWKKFKLLFERVHPAFFEKLNQLNIPFTKGEKRLLALTKLEMSHSEIADTLGISPESVSKSRFRLKKKLKLTTEDSVDNFVNRL